jgi:hypothetical protein
VGGELSFRLANNLPLPTATILIDANDLKRILTLARNAESTGTS